MKDFGFALWCFCMQHECSNHEWTFFNKNALREIFYNDYGIYIPEAD